jgi:leader peptidase (prepilin peptidase) / N-methyltransferase
LLSIVAQWGSLWLIIAGPFVGSFLGVLAERLPAGRPVIFARSACDHCGHRLGAAELLPLLSWAVQRGRCRACGATIDWILPAIELAALLVPLWASLPEDAPPVWISALLGWALLCLATIDARYFLLPDELTLPLIVAGPLAALVLAPDRLSADLIGAAVGFLAFLTLRYAYRRWRGREGLGFGDVKLAAVVGAWVGWDGIPSVVLIAAVAGLAVAAVSALRGAALARDSEVPFGTYLCLGLWLVWLYGPLVLG